MSNKATVQQRSENGAVRVVWRHDGRQLKVTVDSRKQGEMLVRWIARFGTRDSSEHPDIRHALGREVAPTLAEIVTVEQALVNFRERPNLADGTVINYEKHARYFRDLWSVETHRLNLLQVQSVVDPFLDRMASGTGLNAVATLRGALRPHGKADLLAAYPQPDRKADRERDPLVLTPHQIDLLVKIAEEFKIADLLRYSAAFGTRLGESLALSKANVENGTDGQPVMWVRQQYTPVQGRPSSQLVLTSVLKTKTSKRSVPIGTDTLARIAEAKPGLLFPHPAHRDGRNCYGQYVNDYLGKVNAVAIAEGIINRPVRMHDFRHSYGANLLGGGVDIRTVSDFMGHASIKITGDTYGHVTMDAMARARNLLQ